jgi:hypothetical protein
VKHQSSELASVSVGPDDPRALLEDRADKCRWGRPEIGHTDVVSPKCKREVGVELEVSVPLITAGVGVHISIRSIQLGGLKRDGDVDVAALWGVSAGLGPKQKPTTTGCSARTDDTVSLTASTSVSPAISQQNDRR